MAACTLSSLNINLNEVLEQVESIVGYREDGTGGQASFTPALEKLPAPLLAADRLKRDITSLGYLNKHATNLGHYSRIIRGAAQ